ncbi:MAG TPA: class I SAM-dependent methyltransferase [Solirubrobacteraceae bacterium]|jgi:2-polyprenyl-3-methyl-5-hydroxy-6-metoxy-1,4-benzoquinol methylase|nr:class I SAM-dependent methyltransferase [Solirubrobacteraceae bacterium]
MPRLTPTRTAPGAYRETKRGGYYANAREDLVAELPRPLGRVLDVGCGEGAVGRLLLAEGATAVTGIELNEHAAARAREALGEVGVGPVEEVLPTLTGPWDTICCYDVLEHLVDPGEVLTRLREAAAPGAHLHISIPNARHISLLVDLVLRGTFGYTDWGHRDSTHLRWFTRSDIVAATQAAGWRVIRTAHPALHRARFLHAMTGGRSTEFLVGQWYLLADRAS